MRRTVVAAFLLCGCYLSHERTDSRIDAGPAPADAAEGSPARAFLARFTPAACGAFAHCSFDVSGDGFGLIRGDGAGYGFDREQLASHPDLCERYYARENERLLALVDAGWYRFDPAAADACLARTATDCFRTATFTSSFETGAVIIDPRATVLRHGDPCASVFAPGPSAARASDDCSPRPCTDDAFCATTLLADGCVTRRCVARPRRGESCDAVPCAAGTTCDASLTCVDVVVPPIAEPGEPCLSDRYGAQACGPGLLCDPTVYRCLSVVPAGARCLAEGAEGPLSTCDIHSTCVGGTCVALPVATTAGASCSGVTPPTTVCDLSLDLSCRVASTCERYGDGATGEECGYDYTCVDEAMRCVQPNPVAWRFLCQPPLPLGSFCRHDEACASGACETRHCVCRE